MNRLDKQPTARDGQALRRRFFELIDSGKTSQQAARELKVSDRSRTRFLQERRDKQNNIYTVYPIDDIKKFAQDGHRIEDVATRFNLSTTKLRELARTNGFTFYMPQRKPQVHSKFIEIAEVIRLAEQGLSRSAIANQMGIERNRMIEFVRDNGIEITWGQSRPRFKRVDVVQTPIKNADYVVPKGSKLFAYASVVGKLIVQSDNSMAGDRPCITCGTVFRSWHKRNNQRCDRCRAREDHSW